MRCSTRRLLLPLMLSMLASLCGGQSRKKVLQDHPTMGDVGAVSGNSLEDSIHGIKMGVKSAKCDDGQTNLEVDWDGNPVNYTCLHPRLRIYPRQDLRTMVECDSIPKDFVALHRCMNETIEYSEKIPTFGYHRPLWPVFGEYLFVPKQRWLHNLEHGAVVMLYHPCASPFQVEHLRSLVNGCIRKHVITPSLDVTQERPLVLLTWGCRMEMSFVRPREVVRFIRGNALRAPEGNYSKEGQYRYELIAVAQPPAGSDLEDSNICPDL